MNIFIKSLIYLFIFIILHFGYELTQWSFLTPFCGINESVFQHLKMAFWAYLFTSGIEYLVIIKKKRARNFWYPRLLSTVIVPWFTFILWYIAPALFGRIGCLILDLIWAVSITYGAALIAGIMEKVTEKSQVTVGFKIGVWILIIVSAFLYIRFTYRLPWIDLFISPEAL